MRAYEYRVKDYSVLTPAFKRVFVTPLVGWLPWGLPANIITIISNVMFYIAFYLAIDKALLGQLNFIVIPVLLLLYLIGDHLDGAQAKRTGTGSALGEFCDHYLDAFNNGLLMFILFSLFEVNQVWLIMAVLFLSYLAHTIVFYEQFKTGWLIFEKLGSLEGVLLSIVLITSAYFPDVLGLYMTRIIMDFSLIDVLLILMSLGAVATFVKTIKRIPHVTYGIWLFVGSLLIITIFSGLLFTTLQSVVVITLYASWYIGKLMMAHLIDGVERSTGLFTPVVMILAYFMHSLYPTNTFIIITAYLGLNIILLIYRTFKSLKEYWVWKNPPAS